MKKAVLTAMVCAAAFGAFAAGEEMLGPAPWVVFASNGPDCYANGDLVQAGEVYALVWSKVGEDGKPVSEFALTADGNVVDDNHKVVSRAAIAVGGECPHCPPVAYVLRRDWEKEYSGGIFRVYLFDTRTYAKVGEEVVSSVGKLNEDGSLACCNGFTEVKEATLTPGGGCTVATKTTGITAGAGVATQFPADVPTPTLTITPEGNRFVLKAEGLVPYVKYTVYNKETLSDTSKTLVKGVSGNASGMTFDVGKEGNGAFFQVVPENR